MPDPIRTEIESIKAMQADALTLTPWEVVQLAEAANVPLRLDREACAEGLVLLRDRMREALRGRQA